MTGAKRMGREVNENRVILPPACVQAVQRDVRHGGYPKREQLAPFAEL